MKVRNIILRENGMTGIELKIERIRCGLKQLALAQEIGIHPTRLSKIENGWETPTQEEIKAIRRALKIGESSASSVAEIT
jgi:transcriptional regulator with XRE-family HTH domain